MTTMVTADGVHPGTTVQISGLRAGSVDDVELISATEVRGSLRCHRSLREQDRKGQRRAADSAVYHRRKGSGSHRWRSDQPPFEAQAEIPMRETFDVMDLLGGGK